MNDPELEERLRRDLDVVARRVQPRDRLEEVGEGVPVPLGARSRTHRLLGVAAAVVLVAGGLAAGLAVRGGDDLDVTTGQADQDDDMAAVEPAALRAWCEALDAEVLPGERVVELLGDVGSGHAAVYLDIDASIAELEALRDLLDADPAARSIEFVSQQEQFEAFGRRFADRPEFLENVTADVLPPSYRIGLSPAVPAAERETAVERWQAVAGVKEAHVLPESPHLRDALVEPGTAATVWRAWGDALRAVDADAPGPVATETADLASIYGTLIRSFEAQSWDLGDDPLLRADLLDEPDREAVAGAARTITVVAERWCPPPPE